MENHVHVVCQECQTVNRIAVRRLGQGPKCGRCSARLFQGKPIVLKAADFHKHITRTDIPVVVDFWAPWCGPCRMMAPAFEDAARKLEPRARLAKVNTEEEPALASQFGIRSIPTLIIFKDGREAARQSGALDAANLTRWVENFIG